jgi:nucleoside-diphosphate-sugar epimerase
MGQVESKALEAMIQALGRKDGKIRLIYTGGVWLYGATGNSIANETTQFQPMPALAWMVETSEKLLHTQAFATAVIHPAMVYHQVGGAFSRFIDCAKQHKQIEIWKDGATRLPLIHRNDLAMAYRLLLEQPKLTGHFNASAQIGVRVDTIAKTIAQKYRSPNGFKVLPAATVRQKYRFWADGPMLDQQMASPRLQTLCDWEPAITDFATCL